MARNRTEGLARVEPWHCDRNVRCRWSRDTSLGEVKFRLVLSANTTRSVMDHIHKCRSHLTETESIDGEYARKIIPDLAHFVVDLFRKHLLA